MQIQTTKDGRIEKYKDEYWKRDVPISKLRETLNILLGNINNTNVTKDRLYKKIRILEEGKSVETFTIQSLRVYEDKPEEGFIQFKRLSKKALRNVHFKDNCDLIITQLPKKNKKIPAIIIDVHGPVYYPDGSRRYEEKSVKDKLILKEDDDLEIEEISDEIKVIKPFENINVLLKNFFREKAKFELLICDFEDLNKVYRTLSARISTDMNFTIRDVEIKLEYLTQDPSIERLLLKFLWRVTICHKEMYCYPINISPLHPIILDKNNTLHLKTFGQSYVHCKLI